MIVIDVSFEMLLPFFFVLAFTYGALNITGILDRKVNIVIAIVFAFFTLINITIYEIISSIIPYAVLVMLVCFFIIFVSRAIGSVFGEERKILGLFIILFFIALLFFFYRGSNSLLYFLSNDDLIYITGIFIFIFILYYLFLRKSKE